MQERPQHDHPDDLAFEAENRKRRRMGLPEQSVPRWPTAQYWDMVTRLHTHALTHGGVSQTIVVQMARLAFEPGQTVSQQNELIGRVPAVGEREPGEDDDT